MVLLTLGTDTSFLHVGMPVHGIVRGKHAGEREADDCSPDTILEGLDEENLLSTAPELILKDAEHATVEHFTLG